MDAVLSQTEYTPPKVQLQPDHQALCIKTLRFLHDLKPEIEKVQAAGIDVTAWSQLRERLIDINQSIAQNFCNQKPPV